MRGIVEWMGAEAEEWDPATSGAERSINPRPAEAAKDFPGEDEPPGSLPAHNFSTRLGDAGTGWEEGPLDRNPDLWLYRERTVALLRRYGRFSLETGRLPSLIGREFFRAKVTFYRAATFEDRVIFVRDMEMCLSRLEHSDQQLIARVILQGYSHEKAGRILQCSRRTVQRRVMEVIDILSEDFLRVGMLTAIPPKRETNP